MSQVSERHRHLAIEANRTDAKQSLTSKGWFRGNSTIHEGFFKHFKSLCVSVDPKHSEVHWAHGANYKCLPPQMLHLTLPLCPLVFINICFLLQAHSICLCILLSFEIQKTQTLTAFHHLAASLAATLHPIASSDSSDLRPCTHYQCQINLKVLTPSIFGGCDNLEIQSGFSQKRFSPGFVHPAMFNPQHSASMPNAQRAAFMQWPNKLISVTTTRPVNVIRFICHLRLWSIEAPFNAYSSHCCKWMESTQLNLATPEHYLLQ